MVERKTLNLVVVGSIPTEGVFFISEARVRSSAAEHRIADPVVSGSNPLVPFLPFLRYAKRSPCGLMAKARPS